MSALKDGFQLFQFRAPENDEVGIFIAKADITPEQIEAQHSLWLESDVKEELDFEDSCKVTHPEWELERVLAEEVNLKLDVI